MNGDELSNLLINDRTATWYKEDMTSDIDVAFLRPEDLVVLVRQLRQQLTEREQEIEQLKRQLVEKQAPAGADKPNQRSLLSEPEESSPGSQEDLLARLENIYPGGR
jgi:hypothetical protein